MGQLTSSIETTRMGFALALGAVPNCMLKGMAKNVLAALTSACALTKKDEKMAEARRDAVKAITR